MPKIIGFTGAHGVGKSTLLRAIKERQVPGLHVDDFSVSRSVQRDFYPGADLSEITAVSDNVPVFQDRIVARMQSRAHDASQMHQYKFVLMDRTPIDCYAYARLWTDVHAVHKSWLSDYKISCAKAMTRYDFVFIIPPRDFGFEHQVDRASLETQATHHQYIKEFFRTFSRPFKVVRPLDIQDRVNTCLHTLEGILSK